MNGEFLYDLSLAAGLFVGLTIMMLRIRASDRAAAEEVRVADRAAAAEVRAADRAAAEELRAAEERVRAAERAAAENRFNQLQSQIQGVAEDVGRVADGQEEIRAELKETRAHLEKQIRKTKSALTKEIRLVDNRVRVMESEVSEIRGHLGLASGARRSVPAPKPPASSEPAPTPSLPDDAEALPQPNVMSEV